jgi:hypothetical protein
MQVVVNASRLFSVVHCHKTAVGWSLTVRSQSYCTITGIDDGKFKGSETITGR